MPSSHPRHVVMFTRELNSYRVGFFEESRRLLAADGVEFRLIVGGATKADRSKNDPASLPWAERSPTREFTIRGRELWWQPALAAVRSADLVITEQASKQLSNVPLALLQRLGRTRHCLWGHGRNFQQSIEGGSGEGLKKWFTRSAHWFFSYTEASTAALVDSGFPASRITTFNNSTDVASVRSVLAALSKDNDERVRTELGIGKGPIVGYLGALYPPKRTAFLLQSLDVLRETVPQLEVIVIGAGSDEHLVRNHAANRPWLHQLGALYGPERVKYGSVCQALMMPGLVGLNIVDGFALGLPTLTTDIDYHSPEIAYMHHGQNGWVSAQDATAVQYANDVATILNDDVLLEKLRAGARASGDELGVAAMAERFATGVRQALDAPRRRDQLRTSA